MDNAIYRLSLSLAFASFVTGAAAQGVLTERNVSLDLALRMAQAAIADCKADGYDVTAIVVDRSGATRVLLRSDAANPHNAELARRKAYTARTFRITSLEFARRTAAGELLEAQRLLDEVIPLGGGVPIVFEGQGIGGIGVSGGPSQEQDEKCALAGLNAGAEFLQ
jgi:uncharacterized protein GlcG (DUF336 family)